MNKKIVTTAVTAATALVLTGCAEATSLVSGEPTWQEALAEELDRTVTGSDLDDVCAGVALFGVDTPEELGAMVLGFDAALPAGDTTIAEWAEMEGEGLDDVPFGIDVDTVTIRDLANESGRILFDKCGI